MTIPCILLILLSGFITVNLNFNLLHSDFFWYVVKIVYIVYGALIYLTFDYIFTKKLAVKLTQVLLVLYTVAGFIVVVIFQNVSFLFDLIYQLFIPCLSDNLILIFVFFKLSKFKSQKYMHNHYNKCIVSLVVCILFRLLVCVLQLFLSFKFTAVYAFIVIQPEPVILFLLSIYMSHLNQILCLFTHVKSDERVEKSIENKEDEFKPIQKVEVVSKAEKMEKLDKKMLYREKLRMEEEKESYKNRSKTELDDVKLVIVDSFKSPVKRPVPRNLSNESSTPTDSPRSSKVPLNAPATIIPFEKVLQESVTADDVHVTPVHSTRPVLRPESVPKSPISQQVIQNPINVPLSAMQSQQPIQPKAIELLRPTSMKDFPPKLDKIEKSLEPQLERPTTTARKTRSVVSIVPLVPPVAPVIKKTTPQPSKVAQIPPKPSKVERVKSDGSRIELNTLSLTHVPKSQESLHLSSTSTSSLGSLKDALNEFDVDMKLNDQTIIKVDKKKVTIDTNRTSRTNSISSTELSRENSIGSESSQGRSPRSQLPSGGNIVIGRRSSSENGTLNRKKSDKKQSIYEENKRLSVLKERALSDEELHTLKRKK